MNVFFVQMLSNYYFCPKPLCDDYIQAYHYSQQQETRWKISGQDKGISQRKMQKTAHHIGLRTEGLDKVSEDKESGHSQECRGTHQENESCHRWLVAI